MTATKLDGQVALVTGAARGIGAAIAKRLADAGAHVVVCDIREGDATQEVRVADVTDPKAVDALIADIHREHGRLDILVNNAGIVKDAPLAGMRDADFRRVVDVNLGGTFHCMRRALKVMMPARRGRIVNLGSIQAVRGGRGQANYAAAKAGILALTRATALEVAGYGIRINAVLPGFIDTDMTALIKRRAGDEVLKHIPSGRFGTPDDVAGVVLFLCAPESEYVTGQQLVVDGGLSIA